MAKVKSDFTPEEFLVLVEKFYSFGKFVAKFVPGKKDDEALDKIKKFVDENEWVVKVVVFLVNLKDEFANKNELKDKVSDFILKLKD